MDMYTGRKLINREIIEQAQCPKPLFYSVGQLYINVILALRPKL